MMKEKERAIRAIVGASVEGYAAGFSDKHIKEYDDPNGTINLKKNNIFIAALGKDIQYYSALARSLDSSLGNMLEKMARKIAGLNYVVKDFVQGKLYKAQTEYISDILSEYKNMNKQPKISDYEDIILTKRKLEVLNKKHKSDYYLFDEKKKIHYLIELKIGGDLDNKKARAEKEALLEQYCILANELGTTKNIKIYFATAYNMYGEGKEWKQERVMQFFDKKELKISKDFWNLVCNSNDGYDIVIDEYKKSCHCIIDALNKIKRVYLND